MPEIKLTAEMQKTIEDALKEGYHIEAYFDKGTVFIVRFKQKRKLVMKAPVEN